MTLQSSAQNIIHRPLLGAPTEGAKAKGNDLKLRNILKGHERVSNRATKQTKNRGVDSRMSH